MGVRDALKHVRGVPKHLRQADLTHVSALAKVSLAAGTAASILAIIYAVLGGFLAATIVSVFCHH